MKKALSRKIILHLVFLSFLSLILAFPLSGAQLNPKPGFAEKVEYTSQGLRDPFQSPFELFRPVVEEPEEKPSPVVGGLPHLEIQGMVWDSPLPQAIINNTVVRVGEVIEGAEILSIRKEAVYVLYEGRQHILRPTILK